MNFKNYLLLFFFLASATLQAQNNSATPNFEFGVSLLSFTKEYETDFPNYYLYRNRSAHFGLLNGYIFKYHRPKKGTFRLRFRIIGQQSLGAFTEAFDGVLLGDNFEDIGFEIAGGYQLFINSNAKRWKYYYGADFGFLRSKENRRRNDFFLDLRDENKYYAIRINPLLGLRLKASKYLAFSWETSWVAGGLKFTQTTSPQKGSNIEFYWNPISIFSATITIPQKHKE